MRGSLTSSTSTIFEKRHYAGRRDRRPAEATYGYKSMPVGERCTLTVEVDLGLTAIE